MANKISSVDEAISALIRLKAKSIPVRVNIGFPNTAFSFEGLVVGVGEDGLQICAFAGDKEVALFRIAPLASFDFLGLSDHPKPANEGHLKTGQR